MAADPTEHKPHITKKHEARLEKENKQRKFVTYGLIAVVVIVVGLVGYGVLYNTVLKNYQPVAKVGSETITVDEFQKRVKFDRQQYVSQFLTYATSSYAFFFQSQLQSVQDSLDNYVQFGRDTLNQMENEAVVAQKAAEMGITVSDAEIQAELEANFYYYPNGTPTTEPTRNVPPTPTNNPTEEFLLGPTATSSNPTETPTLAPTMTSTAEPTVTGTPATATPEPATSTPTTAPTATASPTITETPTITPTATPYTQQGFDNLYSTSVANIATETGFNDADLRAFVKSILLQRKVIAELAKSIPEKQDVVWARHILVATEAEANDVIAKLNAGESFASLAAQYSTDTSTAQNGGDLGWFIKGQMVAAFDDAAFSLPVGQISAPVQTTYGWHVIQVLGKVNRELTDSELSTAKQIAYNNWLDAAKKEFTTKEYDIWTSVVPTEPSIPAQYRVQATATP